MTRPRMEARALAYLRAVNPRRNIRAMDGGVFEMESGADFYGATFWSEIAYLAPPHAYTGRRWLLIDVSGDSDSVALDLSQGVAA